MNSRLKLLLILSFIVKVVVSLLLPLTLDEYYYFLWGNQLSLSYFDHSPMVGWLFSLSQPLKHIAEGAIRLPFLIVSHLSVFIWIKILSDRLNSEKIFWFTLVALLNPLWGLGGMIATPDIPLMLFWSLAIYFTNQSLKNDDLKSSLGLGAALGLAFLSKYQVVLFLPCLLILMWQQKQFNRLLRPSTFVAVIVAMFFCLPVFIWNQQNDWASFNFQWNHGMQSKYWHWGLPFEYIGTQIALVFPTFLIFLFSKTKWRLDWITPFALFPFAFFLYSAFKARVEGNWVIMAFPSIYALAFLYSPSNIFIWFKRSVILWLTIFITILSLSIMKVGLPREKINLFDAEKYQIISSNIVDSETYLTYSYQLSGYLSFKHDRLFCKFPKYGRTDHMNFIKSCQKLPPEFKLISEKGWIPPIEKDFPDYKIGKIESISDNFQFIEVYQP